MNGIAAVTLDAGGTLITPCPSVGAVYADTLHRAGLATVSPADLEARFDVAWANRGPFNHSRESWARLVARVLAGHVTPDQMDEAFDRLWIRFTEPDAWRVYPDVRPCLESLRSLGIRLAVVSNWDERLHRVLDGLGLSEAMEWILPSIECPAPKPDVRIFQIAADRLGLEPAAILHVGDSMAEDVQGALRAGFQARWLCRDGGTATGPHALTSLGELDIVVRDVGCDVVRGHCTSEG